MECSGVGAYYSQRRNLSAFRDRSQWLVSRQSDATRFALSLEGVEIAHNVVYNAE